MLDFEQVRFSQGDARNVGQVGGQSAQWSGTRKGLFRPRQTASTQTEGLCHFISLQFGEFYLSGGDNKQMPQPSERVGALYGKAGERQNELNGISFADPF